MALWDYSPVKDEYFQEEGGLNPRQDHLFFWTRGLKKRTKVMQRRVNRYENLGRKIDP